MRRGQARARMVAHHAAVEFVREVMMSVVLVPVIAASLIGLIGTPAVRLMASSQRTRTWARSQSGMLRWP